MNSFYETLYCEKTVILEKEKEKKKKKKIIMINRF